MILRDTEETIAAVATPQGEGAIAVLRLSGPEAVSIADRVFKGAGALRAQETQTAHVGTILDSDGNVLDEVVCTLFRSPKSYTGEDVVEISCHGGLFVTKRILELLLKSGARAAQPGEFTRRAFLNGKIDLSQAEAIADLIKAQSDRAHRSSLEQLQGRLSNDIKKTRDLLAESLKLLELELDFAEEDVEFVDKTKILSLVEAIDRHMNVLLNSFSYGRVLREGVRVVFAGAPNVGKSSLLNAVLGHERAIVTDIPGTTRDFIEENVVLDGILFRFSDTAGIRTTTDIVELEGVRRTNSMIDDADIVLAVLDSSRAVTAEERVFLESLSVKAMKKFLVCNKSDIMAGPEVMGDIKTFGYPIITTSALQENGIDQLKLVLRNAIDRTVGTSADSSAIVTSRRHQESLLKAKSGLDDAAASLRSGASNEFIAVDLRSALDALGEIVGEVTTDDILNDIFSKFCIGK